MPQRGDRLRFRYAVRNEQETLLADEDHPAEDPYEEPLSPSIQATLPIYTTIHK